MLYCCKIQKIRTHATAYEKVLNSKFLFTWFLNLRGTRMLEDINLESWEDSFPSAWRKVTEIKIGRSPVSGDF